MPRKIPILGGTADEDARRRSLAAGFLANFPITGLTAAQKKLRMKTYVGILKGTIGKGKVTEKKVLSVRGTLARKRKGRPKGKKRLSKAEREGVRRMLLARGFDSNLSSLFNEFSKDEKLMFGAIQKGIKAGTIGPRSRPRSEGLIGKRKKKKRALPKGVTVANNENG